MSDPRIEAVARYLFQNVVSGTKDRDPDSFPWGTSDQQAWQGWTRIAVGAVLAADLAGLPDPLRTNALALIIRLHREGALSEGQCCSALDLDRVAFREIVDEAEVGNG